MKNLFIPLSMFLMLPLLQITISSNVMAAPAQVVLIRHAEKPEIGPEVNQRGCERAYSLPKFLLSSPTINQFGPPAALFAQAQKKPTSSLRSIQTLAPDALIQGLPLQAPYERDDFALLVQSIMENSDLEGRTVVIAWEHAVIPKMAQAFGLTVAVENQTWPSNIFDEAWVLNFNGSGGQISLTIVPEYVLPGDNPQGSEQWQSNSTGNGALPALSDSIAQLCMNNKALNKVVSKVLVQSNDLSVNFAFPKRKKLNQVN